MHAPLPSKRLRLSPWAGAVALLTVALAWAYWPTLAGLVERWSGDPQYSHGYVVPLFAAVVLWSRRRMLRARPARPSAWGPALLAGAALLRAAGTYFYLTWLENVSLLPALAGLCVVAGGWHALRWAWPAVAFLLFMLPLPFGIENLLAGPLRRLATACGTYALQTAGLPAVSEGTVIVIDDLRVGVADACSGLGMLFTFFALSTAIAFVIERPFWQKAVVFLSAVPVGVAMNVVRVAVTAFLFRAGGGWLSPAAFHDAAGWVMMPAALVLLLLELRFLAALFLEPERTGPVPVPRPAPPRVNPQPPATAPRPEAVAGRP
jgi:exosortase